MKQTSSKLDVVIIGGGLAGLCSAIHLSKFGVKVVLIEKNGYPKHKVCGEYVSNEVLPYLKYLDIDVFDLGAKKIENFQLSTPNGQSVSCKLPLGGFGISRFCFDAALAKKVKENQVELLHDIVEDVQFSNDEFQVITKNKNTFTAKFVIGSFGKRSNLDIKLNRQFIKNKSPYLAVKIHVEGAFPNDTVALHNFEGGYCGVSKVENNAINLCYITDYKAFQKFKNIDDFQENVLFKNKRLERIFKNTTPIFDAPLTISQISFEQKKPVENHIIMCGDTATLIHPLCGNGMSMAIRSAQIASKLIIKFVNSENLERVALEKQYLREWNSEFKTRLRTGRLIAKLFNQPKLSERLLFVLKRYPAILRYVIKQTHGTLMQDE